MSKVTTVIYAVRPIYSPIVGRLVILAFWIPQILLAVLLKKFSRPAPQLLMRLVQDTYVYTTLAVGGLVCTLLIYDMELLYKYHSFWIVITYAQAICSIIFYSLIKSYPLRTQYIMMGPVVVLGIVWVVPSLLDGFKKLLQNYYPIPMVPVKFIPIPAHERRHYQKA